MEKIIKRVIFIIESSTLETKEKNKLLQFVEMVKKDIKYAEDAVNAGKLPVKARSCFYRAYTDCIKYACICQGIKDIHEQIISGE